MGSDEGVGVHWVKRGMGYAVIVNLSTTCPALFPVPDLNHVVVFAR